MISFMETNFLASFAVAGDPDNFCITAAASFYVPSSQIINVAGWWALSWGHQLMLSR
jgi:hypothetical protein